MFEDFAKDMLRDGMVTLNRCGEHRLVINGCLIGDDVCGNLRNYTEDLCSIIDPSYDVVAIYREIQTLEDINDNHRVPLWVRTEITKIKEVKDTKKDAKEVTMAEVEEKFGCKVKIINDKNT